jgi:Rieske Fe-S protein
MSATQHLGNFGKLSRRRFLQLAGWMWAIPVFILLRQSAKFLVYQPPAPNPSLLPLGVPQNLPLPAQIPQARIFLQKDEGGYFALDNVCTHLGCLIHPQPSGGFACPCHGSLFTADGQVTRGPAARPLPYLELQWDSTGQLVVNRPRKVANTFRLPPKS